MNKLIEEHAIGCSTQVTWDNPLNPPQEYMFTGPDLSRFLREILTEFQAQDKDIDQFISG